MGTDFTLESSGRRTEAGPELGVCCQGPGQRLAGVSVGHRRTEAGGWRMPWADGEDGGVWGLGTWRRWGQILLGRFWKEPDLPAPGRSPRETHSDL